MPANKRARRRAWACRIGAHTLGPPHYIAWNGHRRAYATCTRPGCGWRPWLDTGEATPRPGEIQTRADETDRLRHWRATGEGPY